MSANIGAAVNLLDTELEKGLKLEVSTNAVELKLSNRSALLAYELLTAF